MPIKTLNLRKKFVDLIHMEINKELIHASENHLMVFW